MTKRLLLFIAIIAIGRFANSNNSKIPINGIATESRRLDPDYGPPIRDNPHLAPNGPPVLDPHSNPSDNEETNRIRRNAGSNSPILAPSAIISHLVNGIHLQSGLMDGSIPVEALVGELLNLGSVKLSDIAKFDAPGLKSWTSRLHSFRATDRNDRLYVMLREIFQWDEWRKGYETVADFDNIPIDKNQLFESTNIDTTLFDDLNSVAIKLKHVEDSLNNIDKYVKLDLSDSYVRDQLEYSVNNIERHVVDKMVKEKIQEKFKTAAKKIVSDKSLLKGAETLKPFEKMIYFEKERDDFCWSDSDRQLIREHLQMTLDLKKTLDSSVRDMRTLNALAQRTVRQASSMVNHTHGFARGLADLKTLSQNVRDKWIEKMASGEGSDINNLVEGFEPLFKFTDHVRRIDESFGPIPAEITAELIDIQNLMPSLTPVDADLLYYELRSCSADPNGDRSVALAYEFMENVNLLKDLHIRVSYAMDVDLTELMKLLKSLIETGSNVDKLVEYMRTEEMMRLKKLTGEFNTIFSKINFANVKNVVIPQMKNLSGIIDYDQLNQDRGFAQFRRKCLSKWNVEGAKFVAIGQVLERLRFLDGNQIDAVNAAISSIAPSSDLLDVKSIPETMKSAARAAAIAINKFPNSGDQSKIIGQSVSTLQNANSLRNLKSSIDNLKSVGNVFQDQVARVNASYRRRAAEEWGDHKSDMDQLYAALASLHSFDSRIDDSQLNTIGEIGGQLPILVQLSDVKINAKEKMKALVKVMEFCEQESRPRLEEARRNLRTISNLDLEFSKHKTQFEGAPKAFQDFQVFLTEFISTDHNAKEDGATTVPLWVFIVSVTVFIIVVIGILVAAHFIRKKMMNDKVLAFFLSIKNADYDYSKEYGIKLLGDYEETGSVKADRINDWSAFVGDKIKCPDGTVMFPSNFDMPGEFWRIVVEADTEVIIMLCKGIETSKFRRFFKTERGVGDISFDGKVTTLSESHESGYKNAQYEILVKRRGLEWPEKKVKVLFCPSYKTKPEHAEAYELMKKVLKMKMTKKPILVHSMEGMDEPMAFIGFHYCSEIVKRKRITFEPLYEELVAVSNKRRLITRPPLVYWLLLGIMYFLAQKNKDYMKMYQEQLQRFLDKWIREDGRWVAGCDESVEEVEEEEGNEEIETDQEELD